MDTLVNLIASQFGYGAAAYILIEIIGYLIVLWVLYTIIKNAVKNAILESRQELAYTAHTAPAGPPTDRNAGNQAISDEKAENKNRE